MRKAAAMLVMLALIFTMISPVALAAGSGTINAGGSYQLSSYGNNSTITIATTQPVTLTGDPGATYTNLQIACSAAGVDLTIDNTHINDIATGNACALLFTGAGNKLKLANDSVLISGANMPGICVESGTELTISGAGSVVAFGGNDGAGIGGGGGKTAGSITISGGTVTGSGGDSGPGIGSGYATGGGTITITGGSVVAYGGDIAAGINSYQATVNITGGTVTVHGGIRGAGIGGQHNCSGGTVNISGGTVTAYGGESGAGIGGGYNGDGGTVQISGGIVTACGGGQGAGIGGGMRDNVGGNGGTVIITDSTVYAYGGNQGAGIGGGAWGSNGGSMKFMGTGVAFIWGGSGAADVGNGYCGGGASVSVSGNMVIFLRNNTGPEAVTPNHQHISGVNGTSGKAFGIAMPSGWNLTGLGVYFVPTTLTYDLNGGTGALAPVVQNRWTELTISDGSGLSNGTKALVCWNTLADGNGKSFAPGSDLMLNTDITLFAIWKTVDVNSVTLNAYTAALAAGGSMTLTAAVKPNNASYPVVTWSVSDASVATVDQTGKVTGITAGTATITAAAGGVSACCVVIVTQPVTGISLSDVSATLATGAQISLVPTVFPSNATNKFVYWSSDNPSVATVGASGAVTAMGTGRAVITATAEGYSAACEVFVSSVMMNIRLEVGRSTEFSAAVSAGSGEGAASWKSNNTAVAVVDNAGMVTGVKEGSAVITVTAGGVSQSIGVLIGAPFSLATPAAKAASSSFNSITVSWGTIAVATQYEVWRSTSAKGQYALIGTTSQYSYADSGLATGTAYYYKVRAVYAGSAKIVGDYSTVVSAKPAPAAPAEPMAARVSSTSIKASWAAVAGATKYEVWRCTTAAGSYSLVASTTSLSFTNAGLKTGRTYYYKVRAYRLVGRTKVYGAFSVVVFDNP